VRRSGWMDKRVDREPKVSMLHHHRGTLPVEDPDPPDDGTRSNAMRICGPQFDCCLRGGLLYVLNGFG
jgi:hypothetical protein